MSKTKFAHNLTIQRRAGKKKWRTLLPFVSVRWANYPYVAIECGESIEMKTTIVHFNDAIYAYPQVRNRIFQ